MSTRCKPGDLAIIMYDAPQCAANIGRVVQVSGPAKYDRTGRLAWLIQPVTTEPYLIHNSCGDSVRVMEFQEPGIEHPDDWTQPVPKQSGATSMEDRKGISVTVQ